LAQDWLDAHPGQELPDYFVTAMSLAPEDHVRVQAAVQRWTDSAISKTCNAPQDYTIEQTKQLYTLMYDLGCKGGTIYRDGSRDEQILATDHKKLGKDASDQVQAKQNAGETSTDKAAKSQPKEVMSVSGDNLQIKIAPRERPQIMHGMTYKISTAYGSLFITINEDEQGPFEVFATMGKAGGFFGAQTEAITRLISTALRSNIAIEEIIDQLKGIRGPDVSFSDGGVVYSLPDAIAKILEKHIKRGDKQMALDLPVKTEAPAVPKAPVVKLETDVILEEKVLETISEDKIKSNGHLTYKKTQKISIANLGNSPVCPMCANMLVFAEGCQKCEGCGYSKCG
jgi:ribonucleoside-diphosphate reductase alpha chain